MPLPIPSEKEKEQDFISRCMASDAMNSEYTDQKQRAAVCYSQWRGNKSMEICLLTKLEVPYSTRERPIYFVHGQDIRDNIDLNFTQGGNWLRYPWILPNETLIDDANVEEWPFILVHELHEVNYAIENDLDLTDDNEYNEAHADADRVEKEARQNASSVDWFIRNELSQGLLIISEAIKMKFKQARDLGMAVKFVDEEKGIIEGLAVPYGGPMGGKDLQGEYFTAKTDLCLDWFRVRPILYHHGLDKTIKAIPIGQDTETKAVKSGQWIRAQLDKSNEYWSEIKELIRAGKLFFSTGAVTHLVEKAVDGELKRWPWVETSLTPTPANPLATVDSFKAIGWLRTIGASEEALKAIEDKNTVVNAAEKETKHMEIEAKKDFTKPEGSPEFNKADSHADPVVAGINGPVTMPAEQPVKGEGSGSHSETAAAPGNRPATSPPPECPVKTAVAVIKCKNCLKDMPIELPENVVQALIALHDSIGDILPDVCSMGSENTVDEQKPPEKPAEPAEAKPDAQAAPDKNPTNPGTSQGMAPENHVTKKAEEVGVDSSKPNAAAATKPEKEQKSPESNTEDSKNTKSNDPSVKAMLDEVNQRLTNSVKEADALKERLAKLEAQPASLGPVRRSIKTGNPHMDTDIGDGEKATINKLLAEATDPAVKTYLGEKAAVMDMSEIMRKGPQPLGRR